MGQITEVTVEEAAESLRLFPLTLDEARDLLKRAVETQGEDFIYNPSNLYDCIYTPVDPMRSDRLSHRSGPRTNGN